MINSTPHAPTTLEDELPTHVHRYGPEHDYQLGARTSISLKTPVEGTNRPFSEVDMNPEIVACSEADDDSFACNISVVINDPIQAAHLADRLMWWAVNNVGVCHQYDRDTGLPSCTDGGSACQPCKLERRRAELGFGPEETIHVSEAWKARGAVR